MEDIFKRLLPYRDILWLAIVIAVSLGWWNNNRDLNAMLEIRRNGTLQQHEQYGKLMQDYGKERSKSKLLESKIRSEQGK